MWSYVVVKEKDSVYDLVKQAMKFDDKIMKWCFKGAHFTLGALCATYDADKTTESQVLPILNCSSFRVTGDLWSVRFSCEV